MTQQISADFQLSQDAWDHLSNKMNEMAETNRLIKKAIKNAYKELAYVQKLSPKKTLLNTKNDPENRQNSNIFDNKGRELRKITNSLNEKMTPIKIRKMQLLILTLTL